MKKTKKELIDSIISQVLELGAMVQDDAEKIKTLSEKKVSKAAPGATGGLRFLINSEKYFDSPKQLGEIIERLKQEGRHYSKQTISMGLLSLVRERLLVRLRNSDDKNWNYVTRK